MAKPTRNKQNLLDLIPVRTIQGEKDQDGKIYLKEPKFKISFLRTMIVRLGRCPYYKIHLDEFGSHIWERCDGISPVEQIGISLEQKFGEKVTPVYERLAAFLRILAYQKFITYKGGIHSNS
jgi:hypothetical protein